VPAEEVLPGALGVTLPAAQAARRPVEAAEAVQHRALDPGPDELFEARALGRVVAVERADQALDPVGDQVVDLAPGGQLAHLAVGEVTDERHVGEDELVAQSAVTGLAVTLPKLLGLYLASTGRACCAGSFAHCSARPMGGRCA